jgi:hypothetical protein
VSKSRVEITLVRFEITVVSVVITMRVEITLTVYKSHRACRYHTRECHFHRHTCQNCSRVSGNHTLREKSHYACGNHTLRVEINLVLVEITLESQS